MKTLVLYVFHEYNTRVEHFLKKCLFQDAAIDWIVISNNEYNNFDVPDYVKVIKRKNIGFDFGGWSEAILLGDLYLNYENFIFVNSSVYGPFLPEYYKGKWTDIYIEGLTENVKLYGSTINTWHEHVQSYIFSMNKQTLQFLIDEEIFSTTNIAHEFGEAIMNKEVAMSQKILQHGWNIGCLMKIYKGVDFTFKTKSRENVNMFEDDIMYPEHMNTLWNVYELVFIKGNRILNVTL